MSVKLTILGAALLAGIAHPAAYAQSTSPDARAAATEARMTDDERFQMVMSILAVPLPGFGAARSAPPGTPTVTGYVPGIPRLGVPDILATDASLGVANPGQQPRPATTALPSGLLLASTFSPEMAEKSGALIGNETRGLGLNMLLAGGVNLTRDPRTGRNFEYLGEDPWLAGTLAGASITGVQSQKVVSTIKHFVLNDHETLKNTLDARIDEAGLRESDLLAFQIAIERGKPASVMCAYNKVNGEYSCGNDWLLNTVLKKDWKYSGWVISDWGATYDSSYFVKGLDQQAGAQLDRQFWFEGPLKADVASGKVPHARLSDAVRRILRSLYATGADAPLAKAPIDYSAHAKAVREVAAAGIVLLKNQDNILPLAASAKSIAVIGGWADEGVMSGAGSSQVTPANTKTILPVGGEGAMMFIGKMLIMPSPPLTALKTALPQTRITYDSGYVPELAAGAAKNADLAVVFVTQWHLESLDGNLTLPMGQDALIAAVAAANPNTIVVLETGNPVKMPWLDKVKGVVEAWYPGQEGGQAIADVLTGAVNPGGRLPITFPVDESQLPLAVIPGMGAPAGTPSVIDYREGSDVGYRWYAAKGLQPLFAFGHGLSYTQFAYSNVSVRGGKQPKVRLTVTNTGSREGADVPQVYLTAAAGQATRRLVGYSRVNLAPGQEKVLEIPIDPRLLASWRDGWRMDAGSYDFSVGRSAIELGPRASFRSTARNLGR